MSGALAWSDDPLATVAQADAYAAARVWSDWAGLDDSRKSAALLDASTWIKAVWLPPQVMTESREALVQSAAIQAARLTLTGALLGGDQEAVIQRERVDVIDVSYDTAATERAARKRLAMVGAILASAGATTTGGVNVQLRKS